MQFGFLGAGKMATAIVRGMVERGGFSAAAVTACDISASARAAFLESTGVCCVSSTDFQVSDFDVLVVAVKPQYVVDAVQGLPPVGSDVLVISIAAGISIDSLSKLFGSRRVVRLMPNTPLMVGRGASAYAVGPSVTRDDTAVVERIFGSLGIVHGVSEDLIDAVTALSGSGPAYIFELVQALAEAGCAVGLPCDLSMSLAVQTLAGAAEMLVRGMGTPVELRDAVTSPGGTTASGLAVLGDADFRGVVSRVVRAARDRSLELGQLTDATIRA